MNQPHWSNSWGWLQCQPPYSFVDEKSPQTWGKAALERLGCRSDTSGIGCRLHTEEVFLEFIPYVSRRCRRGLVMEESMVAVHVMKLCTQIGWGFGRNGRSDRSRRTTFSNTLDRNLGSRPARSTKGTCSEWTFSPRMTGKQDICIRAVSTSQLRLQSVSKLERKLGHGLRLRKVFLSILGNSRTIL